MTSRRHWPGILASISLFASSGALVEPLHGAASNAECDNIEHRIAQGDSVNAKVLGGATPLHVAAALGCITTVELLTDRGADVNAMDNNGATPLHWAATKVHLNVPELLIAKGANVNAKSTNGSTPLHSAALNGHVDVAELLIAKGVDVNAKDLRGLTPLDFAVANGHDNIVKLLIAKGTNDAKDLKESGAPDGPALETVRARLEMAIVAYAAERDLADVFGHENMARVARETPWLALHMVAIASGAARPAVKAPARYQELVDNVWFARDFFSENY